MGAHETGDVYPSRVGVDGSVHSDRFRSPGALRGFRICVFNLSALSVMRFINGQVRYAPRIKRCRCPGYQPLGPSGFGEWPTGHRRTEHDSASAHSNEASAVVVMCASAEQCPLCPQ
jgi:hypothetical protein